MSRSISPTENQLKARLLNELRRQKRISLATAIANELPIPGTGLRADLAIYGKWFTGVEIKSDRDTLKRLTHQLPVYRRHFDRTILVVGTKHLPELGDIDLAGVEVWHASGLTLQRVQGGELEDRSLHLAAVFPPSMQRQTIDSDPRQAFRQAFFDRFHATSKSFWLATQEQPIEVKHLQLLSRFVEKRQRISMAAAQAQKAREEWHRSLIQSVHSSSVSKKAASSS